MLTTTPLDSLCPPLLVDLTHHRWTIPLLATLQEARESADPTRARLPGLMRGLGVGRSVLVQTVDFGVAHGWVARNLGHGHPLRPDFVLTRAGVRLGPTCLELRAAAREAGAEAEVARKWALPVLRVLSFGPARFTEIRGALGPHGATDRALSGVLGGLEASGFLSRRIVQTRPVSVRYTLLTRAAPLAAALAKL